MVREVKNLTAVAWITAEAWVRSLRRAQWVKRSGIAAAVALQLWFGFDSWPRNFHIPRVWP